MAQPVVQQTSAGGVIVRRTSAGFDVCLIRRARRPSSQTVSSGSHARRERPHSTSTPPAGLSQGVWCLPKGHVEPNEETAQAAEREVKEETGLEGERLESMGSIHYTFSGEGGAVRYAKTVHFFLMRATGGDLSRSDPREVLEARWMSIPEAMGHAAYESERGVLARAQGLLQRPDVAARFR